MSVRLYAWGCEEDIYRFVRRTVTVDLHWAWRDVVIISKGTH